MSQNESINSQNNLNSIEKSLSKSNSTYNLNNQISKLNNVKSSKDINNFYLTNNFSIRKTKTFIKNKLSKSNKNFFNKNKIYFSNECSSLLNHSFYSNKSEKKNFSNSPTRKKKLINKLNFNNNAIRHCKTNSSILMKQKYQIDEENIIFTNPDFLQDDFIEINGSKYSLKIKDLYDPYKFKNIDYNLLNQNDEKSFENLSEKEFSFEDLNNSIK